MAEIVAGDDVALPCTLKNDSAVAGTLATFSIDSGATVEARLISTDKATAYTDTVACLSTATGADWPNSLVVVPFASADTIDITYTGPALVEIQIDDSGKDSYFGTIHITKGTIP